MIREENLHWIDQEIQTWENECQSKHPIKEALYAARRALEQESTTKNDLAVEAPILYLEPDNCGNYVVQSIPVKLNITEIKKHQSDFSDLEQEPMKGGAGNGE